MEHLDGGQNGIGGAETNVESARLLPHETRSDCVVTGTSICR